ncbi:MAG TPA: hypothetical protein VGC17_05770 [Lactovum miscens]|uniref:hypothetical protein n=1 Tax=Lactovum miscens TaxID=190387 RepID=UPI002EDB69C6
MITTYEKLKNGFNTYAPKQFMLPNNASDTITLSHDDVTLTIELAEDTVTKITITTRDTNIDRVFYEVFVDGLEHGMEWSSSNYYNAMMKTLSTHKENVGINHKGIKALHSWENGMVKVVLTKDEK